MATAESPGLVRWRERCARTPERVTDVHTVFAKTEVARLEAKLGIAGSTTGELLFTNVQVPVGNRLGGEGEGFKLAMRMLDRSRPGVTAQALGIAQGASDCALEYACTRETMGQAITHHQLIAGGALARVADRIRSRREPTRPSFRPATPLHRCRVP